MRLINATTYKVLEFLSDDRIPPFAILSHTWGEEECSLQQMEDPDVSTRKGYAKIQLCCEQALKDGFQWAWVDTCCIDKTSTAELSEAINSMFRWYRQAGICYAYLADMKGTTDLAQSRWFTRGWTLQELCSPAVVIFYNSNWQYVGSKFELRERLQQITGIEEEVLATGQIYTVSVARRMSWAANRQTTRVEDLAYCLMGIFDVNMPLLYGEGKKSFIRLQEEIMKISDDHSLFAWGIPAKIRTMEEYLNTYTVPDSAQLHGLFADSPSDFTFSDRIHVLEDHPSTFPPIVSNSGVRIELQVSRPAVSNIQLAVIQCTLKGKYQFYLGFPIFSWGGRWVARCGELLTIAVHDLVEVGSDKSYRETSVLLIKAPVSIPREPPPCNVLKFARISDSYKDYYRLEDVRCSPHATYSFQDQTITLSEDKQQMYAAFFFAPGESYTQMMELFGDPILSERLKMDQTTEHNRESFIIRAKGRIPRNTEFSLIQPHFAVLVGGTWKSPWVESVLILSDDDTSADFRRLLKVDGRFVQYCATKRHLLSCLEQPSQWRLPPAHLNQHDIQHITSWSYSYYVLEYVKNVVPGRLKDGYYRDKKVEFNGGLNVDAEIQIVSSNLVERSLVLFVGIIKLGEKLTKKPGWWVFNGKYQEDPEG
ncbi:HET-domain-containing protein [Melanomma pulvis-pyrius CBS 109.77]|uniref:HET-domain-containing protein n=1 Tax=Melanomma pulvis-pyrius CBS 109.77 TaxID=1314802 RepID=A0A6A6X2E6_9PLEO|nr:HET-domain-containing protein [Melanomma pulvis-pyrius CBS 109.77]